MSSPIQDGGPAFPVQTEYITTYRDRHGEEVATGTRPTGFHPGMTLRDWFAGQAIIALWLNKESHQCAAKGATSDSNATDRMALGAYALADRMLKAREAQP